MTYTQEQKLKRFVSRLRFTYDEARSGAYKLTDADYESDDACVVEDKIDYNLPETKLYLNIRRILGRDLAGRFLHDPEFEEFYDYELPNGGSVHGYVMSEFVTAVRTAVRNAH